MKVKKGCLAVTVGLEEESADGLQRFVIPITYIYHPLFVKLLDKSYEIYGYEVSGPLRVSCSVRDFTQLQWRIQKELSNYY